MRTLRTACALWQELTAPYDVAKTRVLSSMRRVHNIVTKIGVSSRTAAAAYAFKRRAGP